MSASTSKPVFTSPSYRDAFTVVLRVIGAIFLNILLAGAIVAATHRSAMASILGNVFLGLLWMLEGWLVFVYFHYRYLRRDEVANLLATAAEANQPLAPALWAYLVDRPRAAIREVIVATMLTLVYWGWYGRSNFDAQTGRIALQLEEGVPLHRALQAAPGVASAETILAAAVGEATGQLGHCLRSAPRWRLTTVWLDLWPRFVYPLFMLAGILGLVSFHMVFIMPKFQRIFFDFKLRLPTLTSWLIEAARLLSDFWFLVPAAILAACLALLLAYTSATFCWYFPLLGRFYRMHIQSRMLKMLGLLLETHHTVPQALGILHETGYFRGTVGRRLQRVRQGVAEGQPLEGLLLQQGFVPQSMVPLLHTAMKVQNLPWVLSELGDHHARRTVQAAERFATILFPCTILVMGLLIGFIVISLFIPLVNLINHLGA